MKIQNTNNTIQAVRPSHEQINTFIVEQKLGVISTLDAASAPNSATVALSVTKTGELLIGTSELSRKSQNIDRDNRVAVTVTNEELRHTVQLEGTARKLRQDEFEANYASDHYAQRPESAPFKDTSGQIHILITPSHIRFSDCNPYPWALTDYTF